SSGRIRADIQPSRCCKGTVWSPVCVACRLSMFVLRWSTGPRETCIYMLRSSAHGRNGRGPAVDQEVCPDDVRRIVRREVNCQLRDFHRIGQPLARIVCPQQPLDRITLLFAWEATEHRRVRRAWAYGVHANPAVHELGAEDPSEV